MQAMSSQHVLPTLRSGLLPPPPAGTTTTASPGGITRPKICSRPTTSSEAIYKLCTAVMGTAAIPGTHERNLQMIKLLGRLRPSQLHNLNQSKIMGIEKEWHVWSGPSLDHTEQRQLS